MCFLRQIIFNPYGFMFRYNLFDKFVSKKINIKLFRCIIIYWRVTEFLLFNFIQNLILNGNSNNISMIT